MPNVVYQIPAPVLLRRVLLFIWGIGLFVAMSPSSTFAASSVTLIWNPSPSTNVAGYKICCGLTSGNYSSTNYVTGSTNATMTGLIQGVTYYFTATTVDTLGNESPFSNETSYSIPTNSASTNSIVTVNTMNQPPTLNPLSNLVIIQNSKQTVNLTGITSGLTNQTQPVTIIVKSSNMQIVSPPIVSYKFPNSNGTLNFAAPVRTGTSIISVTVNNGQNTNNIITRQFTVTILPIGSTAPKLSKKLTNLVALAGQTVTLSVTATGTSPLTYQWECNSTPLPSATNAVLKLAGITANQAGHYSVTVANILGTTNTAAALSVYPTAAATMATATAPSRGQFAMNINGVPGYKYVVQVSTNMVNWTSVQTNTAPFTFVDSNASHFRQRFYRSFYP
jgi:hypothetical protein